MAHVRKHVSPMLLSSCLFAIVCLVIYLAHVLLSDKCLIVSLLVCMVLISAWLPAAPCGLYRPIQDARVLVLSTIKGIY